jgi:hypothetical protein
MWQKTMSGLRQCIQKLPSIDLCMQMTSVDILDVMKPGSSLN